MPSRPGPICCRPPDDLRAGVLAESERTGQTVNEILTEALRAWLDRRPAPVLRDCSPR